MPVRYILAASRVKKTKPTTTSTIDSNNSHIGTPNGRRIIITIGEVRGIIENQNATVPSGFSNMEEEMTYPKIKGTETGNDKLLRIGVIVHSCTDGGIESGIHQISE
ncbi:MAG: hypothetical protein KatS3mg034_0852 [Vicingaceae bacterium]|nr:MAG: hypothetical protein KatS3mg034_0852 [Vicingaceae bacterium]